MIIFYSTLLAMTDLRPPNWASYCKKRSFKERQHESSSVIRLHPDKVPVYMEFSKSATSCINNKLKTKYLFPNDMSFGQCTYTVRKLMKCPPEISIFGFVGNLIPTSSVLISSLYQSHKNKCGFLVITYSAENTFGQS